MQILSAICLTALLSAGDLAWAQGASKDIKGLSGMQHGAMPNSGTATPAAQAVADANMKTYKNITTKFDGDADVDFSRDMVPHHQGAIDMAEIEIKYGKDPKARRSPAISSRR